jgi:hypothetical protein
MTHAEHRLLRHLAIAVTVKLALLAALWWLFVRDEQVQVDADRTAARLVTQTGPYMGKPPSPPGAAQ